MRERIAVPLLAELDYARDTSPEHRLTLYRRCAQVMVQALELHDQFLLRLSADIENLPPAAVLDILMRAQTGPASFAYLRAVDRLWQHVSSTGTRHDPNTLQMVIALVRSLHQATPDIHLNRLSSGLLVAARTNTGRAAA